MIKPILNYFLLPFVALLGAVSCAKCSLAPAYGMSETAEQQLIREQQDMADFEALQKEREYERMSDEQRMEGVVYE